MKVTINGEEREILNQPKLVELLKTLEMPVERVAVELNRAVVRRADWETTAIGDGDKIEIVHFVGGG